MLLKLVLVIVFSLSQFVLAAAPDDKQDPYTVPKDIWKSEMKKKLPQELCKIEEEFLSCYSITESECAKSLKKWTASCLDQQSIPDLVFSETDGESLGYEVGQCVGQNFDLTYSAKRKDISSCREVVRDDFENGEL